MKDSAPEMRVSKYRRPSRWLSVGLVTLLILISGAVARSLQAGGSVSAKIAASLTRAEVASTQGRKLVEKFEKLGNVNLTRDSGPAVFMEGSWNMDHAVDPQCQMQFAVRSPPQWLLFGWTSDHAVVKGTVNSWGTIAQQQPYLSDYKDLITLTTTKSGRFMLVWQAPNLPVDLRVVAAQFVYACGDADYKPEIFAVDITATP